MQEEIDIQTERSHNFENRTNGKLRQGKKSQPMQTDKTDKTIVLSAETCKWRNEKREKYQKKIKKRIFF